MQNTLAGPYSVGTDCSVIITLTDPFVSTGTTAPTISIQGELINSNSGADNISSVDTGASAAGAVVTFTKMSQFSSCSNSTLTANYSIAGQGMYQASAGNGITMNAAGMILGPNGIIITPTATGAFTSGVTISSGTVVLGTPFTLLGRFVADGNGNLVTDNAAAASPVTRNIIGTYTVNPDCSGTAKITDSTGVTRGISFVLVNAQGQTGPTTNLRQAVQYVFSDTGVFGTGSAGLQ